jgi:hypothetical protein
MENNSPVFRVAAVVQAGAKYEPYESRGVTTLLRVFSNLVSYKSSSADENKSTHKNSDI